MCLMIGITSVLGIITGICSILKHNKVNGIIRIVLAIVCPIIAVWFCSLKESRAYGGTDWEFMLHSATVDGDLCPWILFILLVIEVILIVGAIIKVIQAKKTH